jgi:methyl-accepting chemotaxis protein
VQLVHGQRDAATASLEYLSDSRVPMLGVAAPLQPLGWTVMVEQPRDEAYAVADQLTRQLVFIIGMALLVTVSVGYFFGRSFIRPIFALMRGTVAVAEGRLDERVTITSRDEFQQLGDAFNSMADKLVELTEDVRKKERQADGRKRRQCRPLASDSNIIIMQRRAASTTLLQTSHPHDRPRIDTLEVPTTATQLPAPVERSPTNRWSPS